MGVGGQCHVPADLPLGKTPNPLYRRLGWPQGRSGGERNISLPTGIRSPDRPARSKSLEDFPNTKQDCQPLDEDAGGAIV